MSSTPYTPGPANDTIDLEQVGIGGAVNIDEDNDPGVEFRRGQIVEVTITGVVKGYQEVDRRSADTLMTVRKLMINATDLESIVLVANPEARARRDGQIEGQMDLREKDDAGDPKSGLAEADAKARKPDLGKQTILYTQPNGDTIERGSRWIHVGEGKTYRAMSAASSGDEKLVWVVDVATEAEDAFPITAFGESLAREDLVVAATVPQPPPTPAEVDAATAVAEEEDGMDDEDRAALVEHLDASPGPVEHPEDLKGALGDGA